MTNNELAAMLFDMIGANLSTYQVLAELVSALPVEKQGKATESLKEAIDSNSRAFQALRKWSSHG